MKILALCSGGGGTAQFICKCFPLIELLYQVKPELTVIADRKCDALNWGLSTASVATSLVDISISQDPLVNELQNSKPDLVLTLIHRILQPSVLLASDSVFINTHYSLLPSFKGSIGSKSVSQAVSHGVKIIGATSHLVTNELDSGPILSQVALPLGNQLLTENLMPHVFDAGCIATYLAIRQYASHSAANSGSFIVSSHNVGFLMSEPLSDQEITYLQTLLDTSPSSS